MKHRIFAIILCLGMAAPALGDTDQYTVKIAPSRSMEEALRMPPHDLALAFLGTKESASQMENLYSYAVSRGIKLSGSLNLDQAIPKARRQLDTYKKAIMRRGFRPLALSYDAKVSPSCKDVWFALGKVEAKQNKFNFELSQTGITFPGVAVEDAVTVILRSGVHDPVLLGKIGSTIELVEVRKGTETNCKIILTPK